MWGELAQAFGVNSVAGDVMKPGELRVNYRVLQGAPGDDALGRGRL
jgi:hypothetical protein